MKQATEEPAEHDGRERGGRLPVTEVCMPGLRGSASNCGVVRDQGLSEPEGEHGRPVA